MNALRLPTKPRPERERWELYEQGKARLQEMGLSPTEYEQACRALAMRLGL